MLNDGYFQEEHSRIVRDIELQSSFHSIVDRNRLHIVVLEDFDLFERDGKIEEMIDRMKRTFSEW